MTLLRAFIAIEIPPEIKKAIAVQTATLQKEVGRAVRWVAPENIHLTLKFLGEISPTNIDLLSQALQTECEQHSPFDVTVGSLGCFPNPRRPRVIWIGLDVPAEITRLQHKIEAATTRMGYSGEEKPFSPHLTIGRVREQTTSIELQNIRIALESVKVGTLGTFEAQSVHLYKSELHPAGPTYIRLFSASLSHPKH